MSKKIKEMLNEISIMLNQNDLKRAKDWAKEIIKRVKKKGLEEECEYENLYAHYIMMRYYEQKNNKKSKKKLLKASKKCLALASGGFNFHYSSIGELKDEVIQFATNDIAWCIYETATNEKDFEEALKYINNGLEHVRDKTKSLFMFHTKVHILLKLNRKKEAYYIVYEILELKPDYQNFKDIEASTEYRAFLKKVQVDFTDEEKEFLAKAKRIISTIKKEVIPVDANKKNDAEIEIISINECIEKYNGADVGFDWDKGTSLIVHGNLYIEGDLDAKWFKEQQEKHNNKYIENLLVKGDLYVKGDILDEMAGDGTIVVKVEGDAYAEYIYSYDGWIEVEGKTIVRLGAYGEYNDGCLETHGGLEAPFIFANDHAMDRESTIESIYMEAGDGQEKLELAVGRAPDGDGGWGWTYFEKGYRFLKSDVWNKKNRLDLDKFFEMVREGKNPFIDLDEVETFDIKEKKSSILGFVLLEEQNTFNLENTIQFLRDQYNLNVEISEEENSETAVFHIEGKRAVIGYMDMPIPDGEVENIVKLNYFWENGVEECAKHKAHLIVSIFPENDESNLIQENFLFSVLAMAIMKNSKAIGLYMGSRDLVLEKEFYIENLENSSNEHLPLLNWVYFGYNEDENGRSAYTYGLNDFGKKDIEVLNSKQEFEDIRNMIMNITNYVLSFDVELKEGESLGYTEEQKLGISISKAVFSEGKTIKIEF